MTIVRYQCTDEEVYLKCVAWRVFAFGEGRCVPRFPRLTVGVAGVEMTNPTAPPSGCYAHSDHPAAVDAFGA